MSKKLSKENVANSSNNIPDVDVLDATQTKGKISSKFNLNDQTEEEEKTEKIDKNQLFKNEVSDYFCPVKFDSSELEKALTPLVNSGIMSEDAKAKAIATAKAEFLSANSEAISAANNLTFTEVLAKLQENDSLYKKVLTACKVSELRENDYILDGKVCIYRASQCTDADGNERYKDVTLKAEENGVEFTAKLFAEYRDITTTNILLAIRYYNSKLEAQKSIVNQLSEYRSILSKVYTAVNRAKENKFTKEQVLEIVENVYFNA